VVPVSLIGTFAVMYLAGYSLDNLSLMALTIATGFVVDDAIVVLENIARHVDEGMSPRRAALKGAREIGFTVLSMSLSLIAAFIPSWRWGASSGACSGSLPHLVGGDPGVDGDLPHRHADDVRAPLAPPPAGGRARSLRPPGGRWAGASCRRLPAQPGLGAGPPVADAAGAGGDDRRQRVPLHHIPKGFFPQQDTGRVRGFVEADQAISFQAMRGKMDSFLAIVGADPAVANVTGFTGGGQRNYGSMFITLKPVDEREPVDAVIGRLRKKLAKVPGASLYLSPVQDIRIGGRSGNSSFQFTLQSDSLEELRRWEPRIRNAMSRLDEITDVSSDTQDKGPQTSLVIDRDALARHGLTMRAVTTALNDAYGQRQVSTIYNPLNQYRVVMEAMPDYLQGPESLARLTLVTPAGGLVPLSAVARFETTLAPLSVSHQGGSAAATISFALPEGRSIGEATVAIDAALARSACRWASAPASRARPAPSRSR